VSCIGSKLGEIRDEFLNLAHGGSSTQHWPAVGTSDHRGGAGQHDHKVVDGDWREVVLFGSGAQPHLAPFTSTLMRQNIPDATTLADLGGGEIIFSVLGSKTRIRAHCGSTNLRLTAHLGLSIPSRSADVCGIRVADKWHSWTNGKVLVFDDSYEHEVKNMTSAYRAVLLLRFWHPNLDRKKRAHVLVEAVQAKEVDALRRYNPPLSAAFQKTVEVRGLTQNKCPSCWRNGYDTIRLAQVTEPAFFCTCGHPIL
jgi:aspartate beta-hydroxylase